MSVESVVGDAAAARASTLNRVVKFHAPEIVFGPGATPEAAHAVLRLGGVRPLLVTDPGIAAAGWVDVVAAELADCGLEPIIWDGLTPNPKDHEVAAGFEVYRDRECDVVVGLGGGSVMDAAKAIGTLAGNGGEILDFEGVDQASRPIPPLVMMPTTAGTGADVSQFCIITDSQRGIKMTILGRSLVPDITVIDPKLLVTMPDWLSAATGLDALTHGVEAVVSLAHNPLTDHHALRAVRAVVDTLERTLDDPNDMAARTVMAQAALDAGLAFTNAILGAAHAMSHQVGGMLDLPHGQINGVLLPHVIRYNAEYDPHPYLPIARSLGLAEPSMPASEAAVLVADRIAQLAASVGVPTGLAEMGVRVDDIDRLAKQSLEDACMATNPRPSTVSEIADVFRAAL
ncbi:iron-containing alcohol dehydrogenase [Millisia brevis]|uniref:iron-containing alcohol dehydrogenase n=1 Tax=Millisia brevis TaxID=264148 RepID=UPI00082D789B|nr:iron-containing alcohol dehydrogenase [Millisia brevis]